MVKYFSQLTPRQKDKASNLFLRLKLGVADLPLPVINQILLNTDLEKILEIKDMISQSKMFYSEKLDCYLPVKLQELLDKEK